MILWGEATGVGSPTPIAERGVAALSQAPLLLLLVLRPLRAAEAYRPQLMLLFAYPPENSAVGRGSERTAQEQGKRAPG